MSEQAYPAVQKTAKPVVAGIFNIVIGSGCVLGSLALVLLAALAIPLTGDPFWGDYGVFSMAIIFPIIGIPMAAIGALAIVGGVFALQRRRWGWALAGSIATTFISTLIGIASIILTAISKDEFSA